MFPFYGVEDMHSAYREELARLERGEELAHYILTNSFEFGLGTHSFLRLYGVYHHLNKSYPPFTIYQNLDTRDVHVVVFRKFETDDIEYIESCGMGILGPLTEDEVIARRCPVLQKNGMLRWK